MAPVKIKDIVSFTSQDQKNCVENLCGTGEGGRPWLCSPQDRSGVLKVELQMERATAIGYIDVGNCGSAFIQIDVGRSSWPLERPYVTLLPTATLMSPADSKQQKGRTGVRMFKRGDFLPAGVDELWDRVRVTCSQPFSRRAQFGLSFLRLRSPEGEGGAAGEQGAEGGQRTPEQQTSRVREWLSSPAVQRTFFGRGGEGGSPGRDRLGGAAEGSGRDGAGLSRAARMVITAAQSGRRSLLPSPASPPNPTSPSSVQKRPTAVRPGHLYRYTLQNTGHLYRYTLQNTGHLYRYTLQNTGHLYRYTLQNTGHLYRYTLQNTGHLYRYPLQNTGHLYRYTLQNTGHLYRYTLQNTGHLYRYTLQNTGHLYRYTLQNTGHLYRYTLQNTGHLYRYTLQNTGHLYRYPLKNTGHLYRYTLQNTGHLYRYTLQNTGHLYRYTLQNTGHLYRYTLQNTGHLYRYPLQNTGHLYRYTLQNTGHLYRYTLQNTGHLYRYTLQNTGHLYRYTLQNTGHLYRYTLQNTGHLYRYTLQNTGHLYRYTLQNTGHLYRYTLQNTGHLYRYTLQNTGHLYRYTLQNTGHLYRYPLKNTGHLYRYTLQNTGHLYRYPLQNTGHLYRYTLQNTGHLYRYTLQNTGHLYRPQAPCWKKTRPAACEQSLSNSPPCSTAPPGASEDPETCCPLCGGYFSPEYLPQHASSCQGEEPDVELSFTPPYSPAHSSGGPAHSPALYAEQDLVPCPVCSFRFPSSQIHLHASSCGDPLEPQWSWGKMDKKNLPKEVLTLAIVVVPNGANGRSLSPQPEQWREIVNKKMRFPAELIGAIQEGSAVLVSGLLKTGDGIIRQLDDSEDRQWREALNLAIRLGGEDTMLALLAGVKFDFRQIHEALLVAVDTNQPRVVKRLLDRLDLEKGNKMDVRSFSQAIFDQSIDDSQFAPGVTPLTLACQKDLYQIVTMLTQKGHVIARPHRISCTCLECRNGRQYDLLKFSLSRINTYRGIASRAYLSITSEDAMLSAFRLSRELRKLSKKEPEFKPQYLGLEELCQEFAVELLGMCRNQSEVTTILNNCGEDGEDSEDDLDQQAFEEGIPNLSRLRLAVNYNQKQFVAHPICQQVLSSIWCGHLTGWRGSRTAWKLLVSLGIFLTMPILCLIYWIAPKSKLGKILKIPVIKFLLHSASYLWFLITLLGESITMEMYRTDFASRQQNILHSSFHMVWVVGFFWFECKEVWIEGLRSYFLDWWNCLDMMVLSMYLASFGLRVLIMLKGYVLCQGPENSADCSYFTQTVRQDWRQEDPQLIAEVLFAVTSMLSFTRLAYILPAQESLGTLQISIGKMIDDMMRFMFILMIIGTAFLCGINNIYVPYVISPHLGQFNETFHFLFWTMFGVANQEYVDMADFVLAEFVGRVLYGIFTLVIVIVLLNMLIAMITNSFQKIENDADVEWKFARSKLYLSYFREGLTMPVPFNIIPSPKAFFYLIRGIFRRLCCCCSCDNTQDYPPINSLSNGDIGGAVESRLPYRMQVIKALVQRYIESARREFEETKRKDVGNRITELGKVVGRLHSEMKQIHQNLASQSDQTAPTTQGSSILGRYIRGAKNNFRDFDSQAATESGHLPLHVPFSHGEEENEGGGEERRMEEGRAGLERKEEAWKESVWNALKRKEKRDVGNGGMEQEKVEKDEKGTDGVKGEEEVNDGAKVEEEEKTDGVTGEKTGVRVERTGGTNVEEETTDGVKVEEEKNDGVKEEEEKNDGVKEEEEKNDGVKEEEKKNDGVKVEEKETEKSKAGEKVPEEDALSPTDSGGSRDTGFGSQEGEGSVTGATNQSRKLKKLF
ncbi:short transient receptor potential channel 2-like [Conger conger]|uniref:short transient receptor potential channel 2-like n=1 Tax=Conger conger TaxID=82655 RepID=UPI002A5A4F8B|nr:short transient receptor potential channel 2-like [Conger conger]